MKIYYVGFVCLVLCCWATYMFMYEQFHLFLTHYPATIIMIFGSFLAGSSPEGSASVSYPAFTLLLGISPDVARNFSFAIQSIGMTAASIFILEKRIPVDWTYIKYVIPGGLVGLILGTYFVIPYIVPADIKLFFVSLWFSFGIVLYLYHKSKKEQTTHRITGITKNDKMGLVALGCVGGVISSLFGTGINLFTFCFTVIYYKVDEKVATPSSILIMTVETIAGFFLHAIVLNDISPVSYNLWLCCIPFVIFFAPLGSFLMHKISNKKYYVFLYFIFFIQYFGALIVLRPDWTKIIFSAAIILLGASFFKFVSTLNRNTIE